VGFIMIDCKWIAFGLQIKRKVKLWHFQ